MQPHPKVCARRRHVDGELYGGIDLALSIFNIVRCAVEPSVLYVAFLSVLCVKF